MIAFNDIYRGRKVLITGHTGFKGSWLAFWLTKLGAEVAGYSDMIPTQPSNFELLGLPNKMKHHLGDIRDRARLEEVVDEFRPDIVFHLAAQAVVRMAYNDPATTFEVNAMGMTNMLECLRARPWISAAVLITSDKAYRNDEWCWGYREIDPLGGKDPYSASKSCADLIAQCYLHSYLRNGSTQISIARAGNVIGGGDWAEDRIVPDCVRAWSKGDPVAIRNPQATRPWQHVLEPLGGYLWLGARLLQQAPHLHAEAFNFGPDARVNQTVAELLDVMTERWANARWHMPKEAKLEGVREANLLKLSCDKALFHLQWSPVLDFSSTVAFTVDWYRLWHQKNEDLIAFTAHQITEYCRMAQSQGAPWVKE